MKTILILLCLLPNLLACSAFRGPFITPGLESFTVTEGELGALPAGGKLLVVAPFTSTGNAYLFCRGEDAANFAERLTEQGLFDASSYFADQPASLLVDLIALSPAQIRQQLQLDAPPDIILSGVITKRKVLFNVFSDVTVDAAFRLTFYDLRNGARTVVEVDTHESFGSVVPVIVALIAERIASGHQSGISLN